MMFTAGDTASREMACEKSGRLQMRSVKDAVSHISGGARDLPMWMSKVSQSKERGTR